MRASDKQLARASIDQYQKHLAAGFDPDTARMLALEVIDKEIEDAHGIDR